MKTMKNLLASVLLLLLASTTQAKNYYLSATGSNTNNGLTPATAWQTIAKANASFSLVLPGDSILFRCGDTFYGALVIGKSGTSTLPIAISSYGTGAKPVISGFTALSAWVNNGAGIYQAAAPAAKNALNMVTLNGIPQAVGRFPNADDADGGFLSYESSTGNTAITDNQLTGATNWAGAEAVIRKNHWVIEKCRVTAHSGSTLTYRPSNVLNPAVKPVPNTGSAGFGYFIQRDSRTLDQLGEWYLDTVTKKLSMYFGSLAPADYNIKASTIDTLVNIGAYSYISITNIYFEGANFAAIYAKDGANINIQQCGINSMGTKAIFLLNTPNVLMENIAISNTMCNAIDISNNRAPNVTIRSCTVKNTATLPGMGSFWDDNDFKAISVSVSNGGLIEYNRVDTVGYMGIQFQGNNFKVQKNTVDYYGFVKDDGGAIYTYAGGTDAAPGPYYTNRSINDNIVLNGTGAGKGAKGQIDIDGIYLDGRTMNVDITNNTISNIGINGIYCNNPANVNITGNTNFNNGSAIGIGRYAWGSVKNLNVKRNTFYPKYSNQNNFSYGDGGLDLPAPRTIQQALQELGNIDSNYYAIPNTTGFAYTYQQTAASPASFPDPLSFEYWKSSTGHDLYTKLPAGKILPYQLNSLLSANKVVNGQFAANIAGFVEWSTNVIAASWDNTGKVNGAGSLKVTPAASSTAFTFIYAPIGSVDNTKKYILRFTTLGTSGNGVLKAYIRKSGTPQTVLTPIQYEAFGNTKQIHEFLFAAPANEAAASLMIEVQQATGTTYLDDIEFYEADATTLTIDDQLRFEYNATPNTKIIQLGAKYIGVDSTIYNGAITLMPYASAILIKNGPAIPTKLLATAIAPVVNCFGDNTIVTVGASGGTFPYTGTGSYVINAGKGAFKLSVPAPISRASTFIYSSVGPISNAKNYVLKFSTLATIANTSFKVYLRQTGSPYSTLTAVQTKSCDTNAINHEFTFSAPISEPNASFLIDLPQASGTVYFDNIAFFETDSDGVVISRNLFANGQFENSISNISTWSGANNQIAELDLTSKINNIFYYLINDNNGKSAVASVQVQQPLSMLMATATANDIVNIGGSTTVLITATGGTAPYSGTGNFNNVKEIIVEPSKVDLGNCFIIISIRFSEG